MSSLNQEAEAVNATAATAVTIQATSTDEPANTAIADPAAAGTAVTAARTISRRGEEARGGFVLRAKSEETPHRRRSLVERTGMKTLVQVISDF